MVRTWSIRILCRASRDDDFRPEDGCLSSGRGRDDGHRGPGVLLDADDEPESPAALLMAALGIARGLPGRPPRGSCAILRPGRNRKAGAGDLDAAVGVVLPRVRLGGEILAPQPPHVGAGTLLPCLAVQQSQRAADDVAGLLILAAVRFDYAEVFFGRAESNAHDPVYNNCYTG